jgi:hypothetical protein
MIPHRRRNQKKCFQWGKGAVAPQLWSTINFNRSEKGAFFLAPPNIWSHKDLSPIRNICSVFAAFCGVLRCFAAFYAVLRHFPAFCGELATTVSMCAAFFGVCGRIMAFCGVLRRFVVLCGILQRFAAFCGVLRRFAAFCGMLAISFCCGTKYYPFHASAGFRV